MRNFAARDTPKFAPMNEYQFMEITGWLGSAMVVAAYAMISLWKTSPDSLVYQALNFSGSALLIIFTVYKQAYPPATVNAIWTLIALLSLVQMGVRRLRKRKNVAG